MPILNYIYEFTVTSAAQVNIKAEPVEHGQNLRIESYKSLATNAKPSRSNNAGTQTDNYSGGIEFSITIDRLFGLSEEKKETYLKFVKQFDIDIPTDSKAILDRLRVRRQMFMDDY
jgi:hypothetical protein